MNTPIAYQWNGEGFEPLKRFARQCDEQFTIGEVYWLAVEHNRSTTSHAHQFAWVREAWLSLPESLADQYPSPEHLRKRALIEAGYYTETITDAGSYAAALRVASMVQSREPFSLVIVREQYVVIREAKSQSLRAMGAKDFQESKQAILEVVSNILGVSPEDLKKAEAA